MSIAIRHRQPNGDLRRPKKVHANSGKRAIYVMSAGFGACVKVGTSNNPASRVGAINTGNAVDVTISVVIWLEPPDANRLERAFHRKFQGTRRHLRGEWYNMKPGEAYAEMWTVAEGLGLDIRLERLPNVFSQENRGFLAFKDGRAEDFADDKRGGQ